MDIEYQINQTISAQQFISLLNASGLGVRRPVDDIQCIQGMLDNCPLLITAWHDDTLVGVARALSDFHYACYLSDLAVHKDYQNQHIGKALIKLCQSNSGPECKLILVASPDAHDYYGHIGFLSNNRCWILNPDDSIR